MKYILLAAGKGTRLHPITKNYPKCLCRLDVETTIIQFMINNIRLYDESAEIVVVTGFMSDIVEQAEEGVHFINNPFYEVTNSIASLWFARDFLKGNVTIINSDIVMEKKLVRDIITKQFDYPFVLLDSSIKINGDYNVQVNNERVVVMSKELKNYHGEYAGVTKLDSFSTNIFFGEINRMLHDGHYDQWYENALVQLIFTQDFNLYFKDIEEYSWSEVDSVDDLIEAKYIFKNKND